MPSSTSPAPPSTSRWPAGCACWRRNSASRHRSSSGTAASPANSRPPTAPRSTGASPLSSPGVTRRSILFARIYLPLQRNCASRFLRWTRVSFRLRSTRPGHETISPRATPSRVPAKRAPRYADGHHAPPARAEPGPRATRHDPATRSYHRPLLVKSRPRLTIRVTQVKEIVHNGLMGRPSRPPAGRHQQRRHAATTAGRARAGRCRHQVRAGRRGVRATGER
jgi:hypothetical protein